MKKLSIILKLSIIVLLLNGCWDQKILKHTKFISIVGIDRLSNDELLATAAITLFKGSGTDEGEQRNEIIKGSGRSVQETLSNLNLSVSDEPVQHKLKSILISEELAHKNIYEILDTFYRNPVNSLGAKIIIVEGKVLDVISKKRVGETNIGEHINDLLISAEIDSVIPRQTALSIHSIIYDTGKGIVIPMVKLKEGEETVELSGLALFHDKQMTGKMTPEETKIYMMLTGKIGRNLYLTEKIKTNKMKEESNVSIKVNNLKRKVKVKVKNNNEIVVDIQVNTKADILEYPPNRLQSPKEIKHISKQLSKQFTKQAEEVVSHLLEANCDALGIGRELMAYNRKAWDQLNWEEDYQKVKANVKVEVEIVGNGIIS
ncbi:Ger(x)C family spore germination protein [Bacillus sp. FJAT-47783]|uniref:Ger(x)C family spore germination protein n=1 Tax=Bacillus sp. FJAT-47783 TaxID=2922712 RepID=UPI001FAD0967|nr:Ger(x)C family spore germination protein [Bacillus sp. FJAT-47783]